MPKVFGLDDEVGWFVKNFILLICLHVNAQQFIGGSLIELELGLYVVEINSKKIVT